MAPVVHLLNNTHLTLYTRMSSVLIFKLLIIFTAFAGFVLAFYIHIKKKTQKPMVCPLNGNCEQVTSSKYSSFLGVPLTVAGMGYYALIAVLYGLLAIFHGVVSETIVFLVMGVSIGAFLFSLYLTSIQAFVLKSWCTWCLFSALFTTLIAIFSLFGSSLDVVGFLGQYRELIILLHALSAAIGVGVTTVTDVLFFKYLGDFKISKLENDSMRTLSQVLWFALGLLVLTGIGLYLPEVEALNQSSKFLVKVVVVLVITLNGLLLNLLISPKLHSMKFDGSEDKTIARSRMVRKLAFAAGGISIVSWYTVFILGSIRSIPVSFGNGLAIYGLMVLLAVAFGQVFERKMRKRAKAYAATHPPHHDQHPSSHHG